MKESRLLGTEKGEMIARWIADQRLINGENRESEELRKRREN
jgi:hypothetical protein